MRITPLLLAFVSCSAFAQNDAEYGARIKKYTTEPFFLTELVDHLPSSATVPSPLKHFGDIIGAPNVLHHVEEINAYMRALDKASDRVMVQSMGKSEDGREMIAVLISDAENLKRLNRVKEINALLGDPRKLVDYRTGIDLAQADAKAARLAEEGLPIYYATGGMHSPESGPPEMLMELAYRLAVEESPMIQEIRKNSIVMLTPVLDVDGRDRYVDTYLYRKQNPNKPAIPLLYWGKYVAHDNNRDNIGMALALSKNLMTTWLQFHPTVMHDLHESVSFLYISTGTGPYNAWLDPMTIDEWHTMAYYEVSEMTKRGVPGVWTHGFYDGWAPNYAFYVANGHNAIGRFYETQGGNGADTRIINVSDTDRDWFRPNPPLRSVRWSIRNNTNLMQSAILLGMHNVASHKVEFLKDYYLKSKRSVLKPWNEGPAAYVLTPNNGKTWNLEELKTVMGRQGVEVSILTSDYNDGDKTYTKGSAVVRMDQPYSRMADMLLDRQYYNRNDPAPYDDTGWTLGPLFDVNTARIKNPDILKVASAAPEAAFLPAQPFPINRSDLGRVAIVHTWQSTQDDGWVRLAFDSAQIPYQYVSVHTLRDTTDLKSKFDVIILSPTRGSAQSLVNGISSEGEPIPWKPLPGFPNLGGEDNTDNIRGGIELEGVLHLQKFVQSGGLLICMSGTCAIPVQYGLVNGVSIVEPRDLFAPGGVFLAESVAKDSPIMSGYSDTLGVYFSTSPLISVGGGGFGGARRGGGAPSGRPSGRGGLDDPDIVQGRAPYTPKSQPDDAPNPLPQPQAPAPQVLLRFAPVDKLLISGALDKGEELAGKAAVVRCPVGKGNVLLFAINPMWRQSTQGSWALVFNAIANWQSLAPPKKQSSK